jgi:hypothetical protein
MAYSADEYMMKDLMRNIENFLISKSEIILTTLASSCA